MRDGQRIGKNVVSRAFVLQKSLRIVVFSLAAAELVFLIHMREF